MMVCRLELPRAYARQYVQEHAWPEQRLVMIGNWLESSRRYLEMSIQPQ